jgi:enoyl-CoA hydratase/carnithine racemase
MSGILITELRDHALVVTLNRPEALNAVNAAMSSALGRALEQADADADIRAVVLCGNGRAFCAGVDLKELAAGRSVYDPDHPEWGFAGLVRHEIATPVIAAVHGYALGGGTEITLAADLAVADTTARFGLPEVTRGVVAGAGGMLRLPRQVPLKVALELGLTGLPMSAERAYSLGLVNRVVPPGTALEQALLLARQISAAAPSAVRLTKRAMLAAAGDAGQSWQHSDAALAEAMASPDAREGVLAFTEKRAPVWRA